MIDMKYTGDIILHRIPKFSGMHGKDRMVGGSIMVSCMCRLAGVHWNVSHKVMMPSLFLCAFGKGIMNLACI